MSSLRSTLSFAGAILLASISAMGCQGQVASGPFSLQVVDSAGRNPIDPSRGGMVAISVFEKGQVRNANGTIAMGTFQVDVPISDYSEVVRVGVSITQEGNALLGLLPDMIPLGYGFGRAVMLPPQTCRALSGSTLSRGKQGSSLVLFGSNLLVFGGVEDDGRMSAQVEVIDLAQLSYASSSALPTIALTSAIGRAKALRLGASAFVLVVSDARKFFFNLANGVDVRDTDLSLHAGAGFASAVAPQGGASPGAWVVGGDLGDRGTKAISFVAENTQLENASLVRERRFAAARSNDQGVLVAGGNSASGALFEWVSRDQPAQEFGPATILKEPVVVPLNDGFWVLGGETEAGTLSSQTWIVRGCPEACAVSDGPDWENPRRAPAVVSCDDSICLVGGSTEGNIPSSRVEILRQSAGASGAPSLETYASLSQSRAEISAIELGEGFFLAGFGRGIERNSIDLEYCTPTQFRGRFRVP